MALPLTIAYGTTVCPTPDWRVQIGLILTAIYGLVVAFLIFAPSYTSAPTTPSKSKRNNKRECPDAPKPNKRQRIGTSPEISPSVVRKLFADDDKSISAPKCPDAPKKKHSKKQSKKQMTSVATKLTFNEPTVEPVIIADIRTQPTKGEQLSAETETVCSFYKPASYVYDIEEALHKDADTVDPTNANRVKPDVTISHIINYILTLNRLVKNIEVLNYNGVALPHSGTGTYTTRNDPEYCLVDKLSNASYNVDVINRQLAAILSGVYSQNKAAWTTIPKTYAEACQLCREAIIIGRELQAQVSYNMNLTSWADW